MKPSFTEICAIILSLAMSSFSHETNTLRGNALGLDMFAFPTMLLKNPRKELTAKFKNGAFHVFSVVRRHFRSCNRPNSLPALRQTFRRNSGSVLGNGAGPIG